MPDRTGATSRAWSRSPARSPEFLVEVHHALDGLADLWPRSTAFGASDSACHVFQTAEFIAAWQETYGRAMMARAVFVLVREVDATPLLLLPLAIVRRKRARVLTFIDDTACDYNAPILFPTGRVWTREAASLLWQRIKAALPPIDLVVLDKMPAEVAGRTNPLFLLAEVDNPESCHVNDLARPWPEIEAGVHGLRTLRKNTRALEKLGAVRLEVAETPEARDRILAALLAQKQRRFEETRVPGFDKHPEKRAFFERATAAFAATGALHLSALRVGDEIVASLWGLIHDRRYYALMIGFEAGAWGKYSTGRVLYLMVMRALNERGCTVLDLGIGDEPWKLAQCDRTVPLRIHTEPGSWRGRIYLGQVRTLTRLRQSSLWQRLRPYKWILLRGIRAPAPAAGAERSGSENARP